MNKLKMVVESLKKDMDNIDIDKIIELYREELSVADIATKLCRNPYEINKVLYALQLRRKKKHRAEDYRMYLLQLGDDTNIVKEVHSIQEELDKAYEELDKYEKKIYDQSITIRMLKNKAKKQLGVDSVYSEILNSIRDMEAPINTYVVPSRPLDMPKDGLVVLYGDTHYGEEVNKNEVPTNEYSYEIAKERVDRLLDSILMYPKQSDNIVVVDLKDTIKGVIHGGINTTEGGFIQSIIEAVNINVNFLSVLASTYDKVTVYSTGSNHERLQDFIVSDGKYLDYGRLIDSMVSEQLRLLGYNNITIVTSDTGHHLFRINGANIFATHGDAFRSYKPYDSSQRALVQDTCLSLFGEPYRHCFNGHGHQYINCHNQYGGVSIQNGTMVGCNSYGLQNGMRQITASQTVLFVEPNGDIDTVTAISLN